VAITSSTSAAGGRPGFPRYLPYPGRAADRPPRGSRSLDHRAYWMTVASAFSAVAPAGRLSAARLPLRGALRGQHPADRCPSAENCTRRRSAKRSRHSHWLWALANSILAVTMTSDDNHKEMTCHCGARGGREPFEHAAGGGELRVRLELYHEVDAWHCKLITERVRAIPPPWPPERRSNSTIRFRPPRHHTPAWRIPEASWTSRPNRLTGA